MWAGFVTLVYRAPLIIVSTMVMATCSVLCSPFDRDGRMQLWCARFWAKMLCLWMGMRVKVSGLENLDPSQNYIFVSNHLSYADTPVLLANIPANFRFMAKASLFKIPFLGHHLRVAGHIPVETDNPRDAVRSMNEAGRIVRESKISVLLFPEGGRSRGESTDFKGGAAFVALKSGVPVVPVGLRGTMEIMPRGSSVIRSGEVQVRFGEPIPTAGLSMKDREAFTAELQNRVNGLIGA